MSDIDEQWKMFITNQKISSECHHKKESSLPNCSGEAVVTTEKSISEFSSETMPKCDELYISTKTKVLFLSNIIDINNIFWEIPVIEYWKPLPGVIKKQIKVVSKNPEEYEETRKKLQTSYYFTENIIKHIDNPTARRNKYKDERKITIGMSKKDVISSRGKIKNAFYNCFAMILRFYFEDSFREIHVKVFNTGKLEIPGILNTGLLDIVKKMVLQILQPYMEIPLYYLDNDKDQNVLINSNFSCGFFINREKLHTILRSEKYSIESAYDPCSYPGVKCKFYFNNDLGFDAELQPGNVSSVDRNMKMNELNDYKKYTEISFMVFRTGSCLIVGNCTEKILKFVFIFLKKILSNEYESIAVKNETQIAKNKKIKIRKKNITISNSYNEVVMKNIST